MDRLVLKCKILSVTHIWTLKYGSEGYFVLESAVKIRTEKKTCKPWTPFQICPGWVIYLSHILTGNTISLPSCTPIISHCCGLLIIFQIQLLSFYLPQAHYPALLSLSVVFSSHSLATSDFLRLTFKPLLSSLPTAWLTLGPAVTCLLWFN